MENMHNKNDLTRFHSSKNLFDMAVKAAGAGALAFTLMTAAMAQVSPATGAIDATGSAQSEIAACNSGKTQQDRDTCLREARNAQADKRAGKIESPNAEVSANAMRRCDALAGEEKIACRARMSGYGNTSGSVAGGGVIREVETVVVPANTPSVTVQPKTSSESILVIPAPQ